MTVLKSGSLSLLEPSEPVQACNGIALPLLKFMCTLYLFLLLLLYLYLNALISFTEPIVVVAQHGKRAGGGEVERV